jgi:hypothetical protein
MLKGKHQAGPLTIEVEPHEGGWRIAVKSAKETLYFPHRGDEKLARAKAAVLAGMIRQVAAER